MREQFDVVIVEAGLAGLTYALEFTHAKDLGLDISDAVIDYRKINHDYDFHSLEPGHNWLRPRQNTPVSGLVLAGDYTMQPYFSTMEGAVVSGQRAAKVILKRKNPGELSI